MASSVWPNVAWGSAEDRRGQGELIEASNYTEAAHEDTEAGVSLHQAQSPSSLQRGFCTYSASSGNMSRERK